MSEENASLENDNAAAAQSETEQKSAKSSESQVTNTEKLDKAPAQYDPAKTAEKIRQLSEENKNWRLAQKENQKALEETKSKLESLETRTQERLINSEIKIAAQSYKLRDMEDAKRLADLSEVKVREDGEVIGVNEAIEKLKEAKPYLFDSGTTSAGFSPSHSTTAPPVDVRAMSAAEYNAYKSKMIRG